MVTVEILITCWKGQEAQIFFLTSLNLVRGHVLLVEKNLEDINSVIWRFQGLIDLLLS